MALSVNEFKNLLQVEVREIAADNEWSFNNNAERGFAFHLWYGMLIDGAESRFDTDPIDAMLYTNDFGVDLVFEDQSSRRLLICQCKFIRPNSAVDEAEVISFFELEDRLKNRKWIIDHGSQAVQDLLLDYAERLEQGWSAEFRFVTTGKASPRVRTAAQSSEESNVSRTLVDFSGLKEIRAAP